MFCVRIKDSKFVVVKCDSEMKPIKYVDDVLITIGESNRVEVLLTSDIKGALRFEDAIDALNVLSHIRTAMDDDFCKNLTVGRVFGVDEFLCLYK